MSGRSSATRDHHAIHIGSTIRGSDGRPSNLQERVQPLELVFRNLTFEVIDRRKEKEHKRQRKRRNKDNSKQALKGEPADSVPKKVILDHLDGIFRSGRLTAIMGPSGAGKTSLLDTLAGNLLGGEISGTVYVNGEDYSGKKIKEISGFVFQDDVLLPTMTVREAIEQSATLRLPKSVSKMERARRVEDIIQLLHLEGCQNTKIGDSLKKGISGGERKRTSTAMELIANPPMLFLDEPTSGLDTFTAYTVIKSLKRLTRQGRTVISTIHQPSSEIFHLFDDLLLLVDGRIVYCGPAAESMDYFARLGYPCPKYSNPADFYFMEVLRQFEVEGLDEVRRRMNPSLASKLEEQQRLLREEHAQTRSRPLVGDGASRDSSPMATVSIRESSLPNIGELRTRRLIEAWRSSPERERMLEMMNSGRRDGVLLGTLRKRAPRWTQFVFLFKRASKNALRNPLIVFVQLFKAVFLGLLVGLVFLNSGRYSVPIQARNKSGAIYFLALNSFFSSVFGVLTVFYQEKQVFFREYKAGYYTTTPYFFSKFLVEIPYNYIFPYLMVLIAYYLVGLNPAFSAYLLSATFVAVASIAGVSLGVLIASIFNDFTVILAVTPLILLPLLLLSGIIVNSQTIPSFLNWIKYISPLYYATLGMLQIEFSRDFPNCDSSQQNCSGSYGLEILGFSGGLPTGVNLVLDITLWLALTLSAYLVLVLITRTKYNSN